MSGKDPSTHRTPTLRRSHPAAPRVCQVGPEVTARANRNAQVQAVHERLVTLANERGRFDVEEARRPVKGAAARVHELFGDGSYFE